MTEDMFDLRMNAGCNRARDRATKRQPRPTDVPAVWEQASLGTADGDVVGSLLSQSLGDK